MNMQYTRTTRSRREAAHSRILLVIAALILLSGMFLQITMLVRISSQNKTASAIAEDIEELTASADNLELSINQYHNLRQIGTRAIQLGMYRPDDSQLRVVSVARAGSEHTSTQTVERIDGEEILN